MGNSKLFNYDAVNTLIWIEDAWKLLDVARWTVIRESEKHKLMEWSQGSGRSLRSVNLQKLLEVFATGESDYLRMKAARCMARLINFKYDIRRTLESMQEKDDDTEKD